MVYSSEWPYDWKHDANLKIGVLSEHCLLGLGVELRQTIVTLVQTRYRGR